MSISTLIYVLIVVASTSSLVTIIYILYSKQLEKRIKMQDKTIDELRVRCNLTSDKMMEIYRELIIGYESKKEEP